MNLRIKSSKLLAGDRNQPRFFFSLLSAITSVKANPPQTPPRIRTIKIIVSVVIRPPFRESIEPTIY